LQQRRFNFDLLTFFKIKQGIISVSQEIKQYFDTPDTFIKTRFQKKQIVIPRSRLQCRYNSFFVRVPKVYSKLKIIPKSVQELKKSIQVQKLGHSHA
jgi:hypothetical protein